MNLLEIKNIISLIYLSIINRLNGDIHKINIDFLHDLLLMFNYSLHHIDRIRLDIDSLLDEQFGSRY